MAATLDAEANGGRLVLLNLARSVFEVLELLGLAKELTIASSREEAIALCDAKLIAAGLRVFAQKPYTVRKAEQIIRMTVAPGKP